MAAAGGVVVAMAVANAMRASGIIVRLTPENFAAILGRADKPVVVHATGGVFTKNYQYLTSYKGLAFYTKSNQPLALPPGAELVTAQKIWIPQ